MTASPEFDVLLWGATGFTGRLVAEYLVPRHGEMRLALGGRNRAKLERLRADLEAIDSHAGQIPLVVGDAADEASLDAMVPRARVVCTTVGPYAKYGHPLVAACVRHGRAYCDLTGEPTFIHDSIAAHHERAKETGARIVHCCGFDSIPSDLGTLMMEEHARAELGEPLETVRFVLTDMTGGMSGGTVASMLYLMEQASHDPSVRRVLADPYAFNPEGEHEGADGPDHATVRLDEDAGVWTGPFIMALINTRVVRRTNAILGYPYGKSFRYSEVMGFGRGTRGRVRATAFAAGYGAAMASLQVGAVRKLLARTVLPEPGEGPSRERRERGHFTVHFFGETAGGKKVRGVVRGQKDPGYGETAKMLGESAVCLAQDEGLGLRGGVLTPASAMGMRLVERLREAGMTFAVE